MNHYPIPGCHFILFHLITNSYHLLPVEQAVGHKLACANGYCRVTLMKRKQKTKLQDFLHHAVVVLNLSLQFARYQNVRPFVTQRQLMRRFAVKLILSYEQKCKVRSKFLKN